MNFKNKRSWGRNVWLDGLLGFLTCEGAVGTCLERTVGEHIAEGPGPLPAPGPSVSPWKG